MTVFAFDICQDWDGAERYALAMTVIMPCTVLAVVWALAYTVWKTLIWPFSRVPRRSIRRIAADAAVFGASGLLLLGQHSGTNCFMKPLSRTDPLGRRTVVVG